MEALSQILSISEDLEVLLSQGHFHRWKQSGKKDVQVEKECLWSLPSIVAKFILLGIQNRELILIFLLALKIEDKKYQQNNKNICPNLPMQLGEGGQSKDLSPSEREL